MGLAQNWAPWAGCRKSRPARCRRAFLRKSRCSPMGPCVSAVTRWWPTSPPSRLARTGHSVPEASVHFAGVACRAFVLSALRLRVHERCGDGVRPRRSAPGPKRLARRPKDGRWPAWAWAGRGQLGAGKAGLSIAPSAAAWRSGRSRGLEPRTSTHATRPGAPARRWTAASSLQRRGW